MDKKYTAEEAAKAVLKKAEEMLKSSKLIQHGDLTNKFDQGVHSETDEKGQSPAGMDARAGTKQNNEFAKKKHQDNLKDLKAMPKSNLTKDEGAPLAQAEVEPSGIEQHASIDKENGNPTWGTEPGCHKLSKFMGRREEKSKAKSSPAPAPAAAEKEIK